MLPSYEWLGQWSGQVTLQQVLSRLRAEQGGEEPGVKEPHYSVH